MDTEQFPTKDAPTFPDTRGAHGNQVERRGFLAAAGKVAAATAAIGFLGDWPVAPALAASRELTPGVPPYAPLRPPTPAETASWFNPATDAKWLKNPITLHVASWWGPLQEIPGAMAAFKTIFTPKTGITVIYDYTPSGPTYDAKVFTRTAAGNPFDIVSFDAASVGRYVQRNLLTPLPPYFQRDHYDTSDFQSFALNEFAYNGVQYGLSNDIGGFYLYYNEDLLRKAGITPPAHWTWSELLAAARKLTVRRGSEVVQWGLDISDPTWNSELWPRMNGQDLYNAAATKTNLDDPKVIRAFRFAYDLMYTYKVAPHPGALALSSFDAFVAGKTAMMIDGSWGVDYYRFRQVKAPWNITGLPAGPDAGGIVHPPVFGAGWTIPRGVKDPDASWVALKFYASKYFGDNVMGRILSSLPARKSQLTDERSVDLWPQAKPRGLTTEFLKSYMPQARPQPLDYIAQSPSLIASLAKIDLVWSGKTTPEQLFPSLAREINAELRR